MFPWEPHGVPMGWAGQVSASAPPHRRGPRGPRHMAVSGASGPQAPLTARPGGWTSGCTEKASQRQPYHIHGGQSNRAPAPSELRGRDAPGSSGHVPGDRPSPKGPPHPQPLQLPPAVRPFPASVPALPTLGPRLCSCLAGPPARSVLPPPTCQLREDLPSSQREEPGGFREASQGFLPSPSPSPEHPPPLLHTGLCC